MKVFVTGGSGFVGSAVVPALIARGHQVLGLARSETSAETLRRLGAAAHTGSLEDAESLIRGAAQCDAVVHLGFVHDFTRYVEMCALDRRVVETLGGALKGSDRPLLVTSGAALAPRGRPATEDDPWTADPAEAPRAATERAVDALAAEGVRAGLVRLSPTVHGAGDRGFVPMLAAHARERGVSAWIGAGENRWNAVHRLDAAEVYAAALDDVVPGRRYHAVAESAVPFRAIAEAIGARLGLPAVSVAPDAAAAHFGWFAHFAAIDCPVSSALTRSRLGWKPTRPTLLDDLASEAYFA